ncbi:MAG: efflux RND transporter permease subunit [Bryobacteraceae bacterium]|nr:efflux RND transporter permease subunit [Bryobacteraceae bacterium]
MWIVRLALNRPYSFVVMAILIVVLGGLAIVSMPTDIFPEIDIPVASVIWAYNGMSPEDMAKRVVTSCERAMTTTVNDIERIESESVPGYGIIRVYFHPNVQIDLAIAQIGAIASSITRILPPGITPPFVLKYNAATVPILQLALGSNTLSEQQIYDNAQNFIRTGLATVQGASLPLPYGGRSRTIMVDLDPRAMYARRLSAVDISNAVASQNLIIPAGTIKAGATEYNVKLNASPEAVAELNDIPIRSVNGAMVYLRDVANVRDGYAVQQNVVRQDGVRGALLTVLKNGGESTLEIIDRVQQRLNAIQATLPPDLKIKRLFDQSLFVRAAIDNVVHEGVIAACLTGLMILMFLGSWRSTVIVCISIPLSILTSLTILYLMGQTINVMTLGGLALAVGILVDDATVEIENIHRNLHEGKPLWRAILDGAQQIAVPTFVSTLSICIVFVPVVFLTGSAKYLFTPLALAVVFAMLASYLLSRTLVPTMANYLLGKELALYQEDEYGPTTSRNPMWRLHKAFNRGFYRLRCAYQRMLNWCLHHPAFTIASFALLVVGTAFLLPVVGRDFFPQVDAGQFRLHVRAPAGTRIEETERYFGLVENVIREVVPKEELDTIIDNIGLPTVGVNLAYSDAGIIGRSDGEILVSLNREHHGPTQDYVRRVRSRLHDEFPELTVYFQAADMTSQILNFGLPAPIDIQIASRNEKAAYEIAKTIAKRLDAVPGAADVHIHQVVDVPELRVNVDRARADQMGLSERDVASSLLVSLSSSTQSQPNYWLDPRNGVSYQVNTQTPTLRMDSFDDLGSTPVTANAGANTQLLRNLASMERSTSLAVVNHYNVQPVFDVYANVDGRDLGSVAEEANRILADVRAKAPKNVTIEMRGQVATMDSSFRRLGLGLVFSILLVYLLMVVNFQSWLDPFIILMALPAALAGIVWMLFVTQTTFNVPSLMGAIMSIGVATANSILLVTFANDRRQAGSDQRQAALEAGVTRLRPVIMTALAMMIGMLPMSLGVGEGGEQNAPLGRAVIGGLLFATVATLFLVPVVYRLLRRQPPRWHDTVPEHVALEPQP